MKPIATPMLAEIGRTEIDFVSRMINVPTLSVSSEAELEGIGDFS